eukprot:28616-Pelagococcus_subviridis.AAC.1
MIAHHAQVLVRREEDALRVSDALADDVTPRLFLRSARRGARGRAHRALVEDAAVQLRRPRAKLAAPLPEHRRRAHDERGLVQTGAFERAQKRGDLDGLPQSHLVSDDAAGALAVNLPQPLDARLLVLEETVVRLRGEPQAAVEDDLFLLLFLLL